MYQEPKKIYICEDSVHGISVDYSKDFGPNIWVSFWYLGHSYKGSLRERLKNAWSVLTAGRSLDEEFFLSPEMAGKLGTDLYNLSKESLADLEESLEQVDNGQKQ